MEEKKWKNKKYPLWSRESSENKDELIIEENTIYEIDLECYECLQKERK